MKVVELLLPVLVARNDAAIFPENAEIERVDEAHIAYEGTVAGGRRQLPRILNMWDCDTDDTQMIYC